MTERTRQNIMTIFLGAVLALTVATVWLFGAQRREEITALGPTIDVPELGFAVRMPKGWERIPEGWIRIDKFKWRLLNALIYRQPLEATVYDSNTQSGKQRLIFLIAIPPNASDEQALAPITNLAIWWAENRNDVGGFTLEPLGAPRFDRSGNEHRQAVITFRGRRLHVTPMRYEQIKSQGRIFWCVIAGNTQLDEADKALFDAVVESFDLLEDNI